MSKNHDPLDYIHDVMSAQLKMAQSLATDAIARDWAEKLRYTYDALIDLVDEAKRCSKNHPDLTKAIKAFDPDWVDNWGFGSNE